MNRLLNGLLNYNQSSSRERDYITQVPYGAYQRTGPEYDNYGLQFLI